MLTGIYRENGLPLDTVVFTYRPFLLGYALCGLPTLTVLAAASLESENLDPTAALVHSSATSSSSRQLKIWSSSSASCFLVSLCRLRISPSTVHGRNLSDQERAAGAATIDIGGTLLASFHWPVSSGLALQPSNCCFDRCRLTGALFAPAIQAEPPPQLR